MKKKTILILTIISSIISIIYILYCYFGFDRYLECHYRDSKKFIENYKNVNKINNKNIVVSFTTTKDRINNIKPMINSLLDQTIKVDRIYLVNYLFDDNDIPKYLDDIVNKIPCKVDYGYGTSIIPILLKEKDKNTIIINVKDNIVYSKDFLENVVDEIKSGEVLSDDNFLAFKPLNFSSDIIDRSKNKYTKKWFTTKCNKLKNVKYRENYPLLSFKKQ
jgi:hypothetical protein